MLLGLELLLDPAAQTGATGPRPARSATPTARRRSPGAKSRARSAGLDEDEEEMQQHSSAQRRQLGAAHAMQIPDTPIPLTLAGPAADDHRMTSLSACIDPFWGAPGLHAAQCADAACDKGDHAMCGGHIAAHCADLCPRICRRFPRASVAPTALARLTACPARLPHSTTSRRERCFTPTACQTPPAMTTSSNIPPRPSSSSRTTPTSAPFLPCSVSTTRAYVPAMPLEFDSIINEYKVEIRTLVRNIVAARPAQIYAVVDYRQAQYCTPAACALNLKLTTVAVHVGSLVDHFTRPTTVTGKRDPHTLLPRLCQLVVGFGRLCTFL